MSGIPQELLEKVTHAICEAEGIHPEDCLTGHDINGHVYYPRVNGEPVLMTRLRQTSARAAICALMDAGWKAPEQQHMNRLRTVLAFLRWWLPRLWRKGRKAGT